MAKTESGGASYLAAAAVGGVCGGIVALLATRELPRLMSEMKQHFEEVCDEKCGCAPGERREESADTAETCCN